MPGLPRAARAALVFILLASIAHAGQLVTADSAGSAGDPAADLPFAFDGLPVPVAPGVITRDGEGRVTLRAVRLSSPIRLDGQLDEAVYAATPAFSDFFQMEPVEGAIATEKTEGWIFFDEDALYATFRCWESRPDALVANEMRRDNSVASTAAGRSNSSSHSNRFGIDPGAPRSGASMRGA